MELPVWLKAVGPVALSGAKPGYERGRDNTEAFSGILLTRTKPGSCDPTTSSHLLQSVRL